MDIAVDLFETFVVEPVASAAGQTLAAIEAGGNCASTAAFVSNLGGNLPAKDSPLRQFVVAWFVLTLGGTVFYFFFSGLNYYFVHREMGNLGHSPFKGQVKLEIEMSMKAMPIMAALTAPFVVLECQGYSRLYGPGTEDSYMDYGHLYNALSVVWFLFFTDMCVYWIHRGLHLPMFYKTLHKDHHKWKNTTPFASHAFHPVDGWAQSVPYHVFVFLFPMHKIVFLSLFVFVNVWTVSIHDGVSSFPFKLLNGAAHHTYHHKEFNYNYGQYFILWDWLCGTMRDPYEPGRLLNRAGATEKAKKPASPRVAGEKEDVGGILHVESKTVSKTEKMRKKVPAVRRSSRLRRSGSRNAGRKKGSALE